MTIHHGHSWPKRHWTILRESVHRGTAFTCFTSFATILYTEVLFTNVVCVITVLLSHLHQASRNHYFHKVRFRKPFVAFSNCFKTFKLFILRKDFSLWTFCSLPTAQLDSNILLNDQQHYLACMIRITNSKGKAPPTPFIPLWCLFPNRFPVVGCRGRVCRLTLCYLGKVIIIFNYFSRAKSSTYGNHVFLHLRELACTLKVLHQ